MRFLFQRSLFYSSHKNMKRRDLLLAIAGLSTTTVITGIDSARARSIKTGASSKPIPRAGRMVKLDTNLLGYYVAPPTNQPVPAILVMMEAFGLNDNIKGVCNRLAQNGYAALAPDFYHGQTFPYSDLKGAIAKLKSLQDEVTMAEFGKGLEFLKKQKKVSQRGVGVTGFCMGGRLTFLANATYPQQVKAAVSFYGGGIAAKNDVAGRQNLLAQAKNMQAPLMLMYGSEDSYIVAEEHERIAAALSQAKKRYAINVFPGAGHGFMSDRRESYNAAAATEAWDMTMAFFDRHLRNQKIRV
jgi:carboxymethylenebutenolidase